MEEGVEFSGKTVEDATVQAESHFGAARTNLNIQVITAGRSGVFGIGAEPARIRAAPRLPARVTMPEPEPEPITLEAAHHVEEEHEEEIAVVDTHQAAVASPPEAAVATAEPDEESSDLAAEAAEVLSNLLHSMGFNADVTVRSRENPVMLAITGDNLGVLIGRRGDNLSSLQFMVNLILSKNRRHWPRVVVDVENYRARREESLRSLADRIAYRVRRNQRPFTLEAMPAGDRRVIHLTLRDAGDVETYSIGEGVARRVVVAPRRGGQAAGDRY